MEYQSANVLDLSPHRIRSGTGSGSGTGIGGSGWSKGRSSYRDVENLNVGTGFGHLNGDGNEFLMDYNPTGYTSASPFHPVDRADSRGPIYKTPSSGSSRSGTIGGYLSNIPGASGFTGIFVDMRFSSVAVYAHTSQNAFITMYVLTNLY